MKKQFKQKNMRISIFLIVTLFLLSSLFFSSFILEENKICFIVRFGKIIKKIDKSGLKFKNPIIDDVIFFEKKIIHLDLEGQEIISIDQKRFTVDAYLKYKIINPDLFYKTLRNQTLANKKINSIFDSLVRQVLGTKKFINILNKDRSSTMNEIEIKLNDIILQYGLEIADVRIVRVDLPFQNNEAIFKRMRTEREKEAVELLSAGQKEAEFIKSESEKEASIIISEAKLKAEQIKSDANGKAMSISNLSFGKDVKFYQFWKKLEIYKNLKNQNTNFTISQEKMKNIDIFRSTED